MELNKNKGKWFSEQNYETGIVDDPTLLDDVAYYLYCADRTNNSCSPQVTFMWNVQKFSHPKMIKYYKKAEKFLKLEKLIIKCNEN